MIPRYLELEKKLIEIEPKDRIVFVGDTHGDFDATQMVFNRYSPENPRNKIVLLGDYVDRGSKSRENADFVIEQSKKYPEQVIPLQGNHDAYYLTRHKYKNPDFWETLDADETIHYIEEFAKFPLAVSVGDILAVHGGLPNLLRLSDFNTIRTGDHNWQDTVWGDFRQNMEFHEYVPGRPQFSENYFDRVMEMIGKKLLIRSHTVNPFTSMFNGRCLTLMTSSVCKSERTIAVADYSEKPTITSDRDLVIEKI